MSFAIRISLYLFCLAALVSCHNQNVQPQLCLLTAIKDSQGKILESFEYNQNEQLIKHIDDRPSTQITRTIEYNDAGQISQVIEGTKQYPRYWVYTHRYSDNGREVVQDKKCEVGNAFFKFNLLFNQSGLLTQFTHPDIEYIRYEHDTAGDVYKVFFRRTTSEEFNIVQYDDFDGKPSPVSGSKSLQQYMQLVLKSEISLHNFRTYRYHYLDKLANLDYWNTTDSISYTYNSQGYPTQVNGISVAYSARSYASITYEYNCP